MLPRCRSDDHRLIPLQVIEGSQLVSISCERGQADDCDNAERNPEPRRQLERLRGLIGNVQEIFCIAYSFGSSMTPDQFSGGTRL